MEQSKAVNVLLTSVGRRNYLVEYFRRIPSVGRLIAVDSNPTAPGLSEADDFEVIPDARSKDYIERLLDVCKLHRVDLLVPLNDLELPSLSAARAQFLGIGTTPVVSSPRVIEIGWDKIKTGSFLTAVGIAYPRTTCSLEAAKNLLDEGAFHFPLVLKPRWGSGSIGVEIVHSLDEMMWAMGLLRAKLERTILWWTSRENLEGAILFQQVAMGREYGLDVINDLAGRHVHTNIREKLGMRAGETDRARIVHDDRLMKLGRTIGEHLSHIGNLDVDVICTEDGPQVIDLNPRFGGGYPFAHQAGANLPLALVRWCRGEPVNDEIVSTKDFAVFGKCERIVRCTD